MKLLYFLEFNVILATEAFVLLAMNWSMHVTMHVTNTLQWVRVTEPPENYLSFVSNLHMTAFGLSWVLLVVLSPSKNLQFTILLEIKFTLIVDGVICFAV